jgi:hypothetical protein
MKAFLLGMFTEKDNTTPCPVRIAAGAANAVYHFAAIAGIAMGHITLDINTLGLYLQHMSMIIATGGVSVGAKSIMKADA